MKQIGDENYEDDHTRYNELILQQLLVVTAFIGNTIIGTSNGNLNFDITAERVNESPDFPLSGVGRSASSWKNQKFWSENQMVQAIRFRQLQKIWTVT